jgi:molybdate transport system substrate-binding protein
VRSAFALARVPHPSRFSKAGLNPGWKLAFVALFVLTSTLGARSQELTVAAAADLHSTMDEIAAAVQSKTSMHVKIIYGSSGNFFQQIQNGAPFDVFLSANADYPKKLDSAGLAAPNSYYEYGRGKLVLLVSAKSNLDLHPGLRVLTDRAVKKVSIADPSHAPYGQAAVAAMKAENIYQAVSPKIVMGENVSQATSFVLSGAADVGLVALSLAKAPETRGQVRYAEITSADFPPIQQACIVLRSSKNQKLALQFESFLRSPDAVAIFQKFGFETPAGKPAKSR